VAQLVPADHRPDRLDLTVGDVQGKHADQGAVAGQEQRAGLPVHLRRRDLSLDLAQHVDQADDQTADLFTAGDWPRPGRPHATAVAVHLDVGGEHADQPIHIAVASGGEEPCGQFCVIGG